MATKLMKTPQIFSSFRARLVLLLVVLLGLTLGVQYYVNLQSVKRNAHMLVEQEQAIMAASRLALTVSTAGNTSTKFATICASR